MLVKVLIGAIPITSQLLKGGRLAMAKIEFDFEDEHYTLEFSRRTVAALENNGFVMDKAMEKPMNMLPMLFRGAFGMHHPRIKEEVVNTIFKSLENKDELFATLIEMYQEPLNAMFEENTDGKKVTWKKS